MELEREVVQEEQCRVDGVKSDPEEDDKTAGHACGLCGRSFPLLSSLSQHMRRHNGEKPYKCPYCEHRVAQKGSLKAHVRGHKLGLLSRSLGKTEGEEENANEKRVHTDGDTELPDSPANGSSAKKPKFNGKAKKRISRKKCADTVIQNDTEEPSQTAAEFDSMPERANGVDEGIGEADKGSFPCGSCSQVFPRALLLKAHAKKHRSSLDHGCRICGRRFRQAWFLQSHMRIHRTNTQLRGGGGGDGGEPQATVNGVPRDPASLVNDGCLYELCAGCGNFFYDRKTLRLHERLHKQSHTPSKQSHGPTGNSQQADSDNGSLSPAAKRQFLECLNLRAAGAGEAAEDGSLGRRIPELDPVCSYQAWQLVTRGRVAEATERGWKEMPADEELAFNQEKGTHVPLKQEKRKRQLDTSQSKKKKGSQDAVVNHQQGNSRNGPSLLNGLNPETFGILQKKKVRDQSNKQSTKSNSASQTGTAKTNSIRDSSHGETKPYTCDQCDFHTSDPSSFTFHMHKQHQDIGDTHHPLLGAVIEDPSHKPPHASGYMEYLRLKSTLLSRPYWNPRAGHPGQERATTRGRPEKSKTLIVKGPSSQDATVGINLLNLSAPEGQEEDVGTDQTAVASEGALVRHHCPFCAHTTHYPEVLWIHQRVSHRVDSGSSLAPKWAPYVNGVKCPKAAGRRTGPPPFLEGKDCPAFPVPHGQRTQPPCSVASQPSAGGAKRPKTHAAAKTSRAQSNGSQVMGSVPESHGSTRSPPGGGKNLIPQKKKLNRPCHAVANESPQIKPQALPKTAVTPNSGSASVRGLSKQSGAPKSRIHHRAAAEGSLLPQEGLGFILSRNHGRADHTLHTTPDRKHLHQPHPGDPPTASKGHDLWSVMNMLGGPGSSGYLAPPNLHGNGKMESPTGDCGDTPMDIDILGLLKNYKSQDLAALYQHWGFVDPRLDQHAILEYNRPFGNEVSSSTEASKQASGGSPASATTLRKGT
ncbi:hypothetical protein DPEC_G00202730 [Dallia pectoralis]|uniref:Uncharacterized protein n=1 Tax=Dallia pectoralis TaxID=75939 RepID=A0ACC2G9S6_DALPE|nr:hypothetical protein DPEC_G00202730 [Dallia pectoralis]